MNSLTLECKTCSNYVAVENAGPDSAIETTPCGVCGVALCEACDQVDCAECGELMCVECAHHGLGECVACVNARLAELETASVPCTCGNGDYADVRGCESCDPASPYRRELARAEETAAAIALRVPECEHLNIRIEEHEDPNDEYVKYFEEITCRDCGEELVERKGELVARKPAGRAGRGRSIAA